MQVKTTPDVEVKHNGKKVRVDIEASGRTGAMSPQHWMIIYQGRRITEFEQRLRGWEIPFHAMLKIVYNESIKEAFDYYSTNPLLDLFKKEKGSLGSYVPVPINYKK